MASVVIRIVADRWGMVLARSIGGIIMLTGLMLMSLVMYDSSNEKLLRVAWPCLSMGGVINHMQNIHSCRSIPVASATLMTFFSGCFAAGGATMMLMVMFQTRFGIDYFVQFAALAALFGVILIVKLIFWTPLFMPEKSDPFSLYRESWLLKKLTSVEDTGKSLSTKINVLRRGRLKIKDLWIMWQL